MSLVFDNQVAMVTGAGNGLGRSHALALARRGAKVVVNDIGADVGGKGSSETSAQSVVDEIVQAGGEALVNYADVTDFQQVCESVNEIIERWGRIDILVNNAGILRDKSFAKMEMDDFRQVLDVHLMGSVHCCKAVWDSMQKQRYGRIIVTTSPSALYGNFGQANYSSAKMALVGFMNTLAIEGEKYGIRVNALAPAALTRMTECIVQDPDAQSLLTTSSVTDGLLVLCQENAPNKTILCAGAGSYSVSFMQDTQGVVLAQEDHSPEQVNQHWSSISDTKDSLTYRDGIEQIDRFVNNAKKC